MNKYHDIIVIPDVHGRSFWKKAIPEDVSNHLIIFLGDYFDPYPDEADVSWAQLYERVSAIISLKKAHPDNVILLLGNHDLHYIWRNALPQGGRYDFQHADDIAELLSDNWACFQLACECSLGNRQFLLTHAGVSRQWLEQYPALFPNPDDVTAETLNNLFDEGLLMENLGDIGKHRGGVMEAGSPIWADVREMCHSYNWIGHYVQIFGHTQGHFVREYDGRAYCLDCRMATKINAQGQVLATFFEEDPGLLR